MGGTLRLSYLALAMVLGGAVSCGGADGATPKAPASKAALSPPAASSDLRSPPSGVIASPALLASTTRPPSASGPWPLGVLSAEERDALLGRLRQNPGPLKSNWVPPGRRERYGHAEGLVAAPPDVVRAKLVDFARYKDLAGPKFKSVKVIDKQGDSTDVYFQLPVMKGLITLWYVTRFPPARVVAGGDVIEGTFVRGNIKGMHIAFTVRPGEDEQSSVLVCDLVLKLNIPAPQSALDEELRDACGDAIRSLRKTIVALAP